MKFYYLIIVENRKGKEAIPVQVDNSVDLMDGFSKHITVGDDIVKVYPTVSLEQAKELAREINNLQTKTLQEIEIVVAKENMELKKYNSVSYLDFDVEQENERIERMTEWQRNEIDRRTCRVEDEIDSYYEYMKKLLGDKGYTKNVEQVKMHFGQISIGLSDATM